MMHVAPACTRMSPQDCCVDTIYSRRQSRRITNEVLLNPTLSMTLVIAVFVTVPTAVIMSVLGSDVVTYLVAVL